jgi:hypothetical protein
MVFSALYAAIKTATRWVIRKANPTRGAGNKIKTKAE